VTALEKAHAAYGASIRVTRSPRDTEFDVLARVTKRLRAACGPDAPFPEFARAIHDNRSLWSLFALDLALPTNGLPKELRDRLLSLARFVDDHSSRVLKDAATADVLIEINTAIMRGLRPPETQP
jgi:flagellar biosynthesis activator protein FlaF